jgi:predicted transcriptional regulator
MLRWLKSSHVERHRLGPLETQLLRVLWRRGDATVRELVSDPAIRGAYTTIMTTLDRLHKKGLLDRAADGRAYRYSPKLTEEEYNRNTFAAGLAELLNSARDSAAPLSFLVDSVTEHDAKLLGELERVVERKRQELKKGRKR